MRHHILAGVISALMVIANAPWAAAQSGDMLPLETVIAQVRESVGGNVVGIELERERGRWVYEVKVVGSDGRITEMEVDAHTGSVISRHIRRRGSWD
ncbi:hypothetical protein AMST5_02577 [freshwater sediment metagenome]|jgi:uncharacterized membrane protein YkoI|uniref:PepSY domain-containing protein n=1 Tax=freshwater sediment metagenome TaxID=556182 RepID=A0AA48M084_9ZZZZ